MLQVWTENAWAQYEFIEKNDKSALKKVKGFIKEIIRSDNPYEGTGMPEPLKDDLSGYYSRRIDKKNRFVYRVCEFDGQEAIEILSCYGHY